VVTHRHLAPNAAEKIQPYGQSKSSRFLDFWRDEMTETGESHTREAMRRTTIGAVVACYLALTSARREAEPHGKLKRAVDRCRLVNSLLLEI
jgi:hypothetical protein